jgi:hypothetical protein
MFRKNHNYSYQIFIIIDTVQDEEYQFNHDIKFLTSGLSCSIEKIGDYERKRELWAIKK